LNIYKYGESDTTPAPIAEKILGLFLLFQVVGSFDPLPSLINDIDKIFNHICTFNKCPTISDVQTKVNTAKTLESGAQPYSSAAHTVAIYQKLESTVLQNAAGTILEKWLKTAILSKNG